MLWCGRVNSADPFLRQPLTFVIKYDDEYVMGISRDLNRTVFEEKL